MQIILEACVGSPEEALRAEQHGASRLELCADLHLDGTTPEPDLIKTVMAAVQIPVKVMIRPRGGDFVYNEDEFRKMMDSIGECKALNVPEIVTGILHPDHTLDIDQINRLAQAAQPMSVTIHKCIDAVPDVFRAIEQLKFIPGITAILSSGQADTALQGAGMLKKMMQACGEKLTLIVAGKVTQENLSELIDTIGANEYHGRRIVE